MTAAKSGLLIGTRPIIPKCNYRAIDWPCRAAFWGFAAMGALGCGSKISGCAGELAMYLKASGPEGFEMSKVYLALAASSLFLFGCVTDTVWYREGAKPNKVNNDATNCAVDAAQRVPQNNQIGQTPVYGSPMQTYCSGTYYVTCTTYGGNVSGGNLYSYDANAGLRDDVMEQCMGRKGYSRVELPVCSTEVASKITSYPATLPKLTETSCLIDHNGSYAVVTP